MFRKSAKSDGYVSTKLRSGKTGRRYLAVLMAVIMLLGLVVPTMLADTNDITALDTTGTAWTAVTAVDYGTSEEDLAELLPKKVEATIEGAGTVELDIDGWSGYSATTLGSQALTAELDLTSGGYRNPMNIEAKLTINVVSPNTVSLSFAGGATVPDTL